MFWGEFARSWPIESARRCTVADGLSGLAGIGWETLVKLSLATCRFRFHMGIAHVEAECCRSRQLTRGIRLV